MRTRKRRTVHLIKATVNYLRFTYKMSLFETEEKRLSLKNGAVSDLALYINENGQKILTELNKVPPTLKIFIYEKVKEILSGKKTTLSRKEKKGWPIFKHEKVNKDESDQAKTKTEKEVIKHGKKTKQIDQKTSVLPGISSPAVLMHDGKA